MITSDSSKPAVRHETNSRAVSHWRTYSSPSHANRASGSSSLRVEKLEGDRDALIESMSEMVPEALDNLTSEEKKRIYQLLRLEVKPDPEGYEVSGALCSRRPKGRRRSCFTKDSSSAPLTWKPSGIGVTSILNIANSRRSAPPSVNRAWNLRSRVLQFRKDAKI